MYEFYFWCGVALISLSTFLMLATKSLDIRGVLAFIWGIVLVVYTSQFR